MPRGLMLLLVRHFLEIGDLEAAVITATSFEQLLRTASELVDVSLQDVTWPGSVSAWTGSDKGSVKLSNTKTRSLDSFMLRMDDTDVLSTTLLLHWFDLRVGQGATPDSRLFTYRPNQYRAAFHRGLIALGLPETHPYYPHSMRAGGAVWLEEIGMSIDGIRRRGRWDRIQTTELYLCRGRAMLGISTSLPPSLEPAARHLMKYPLSLLSFIL